MSFAQNTYNVGNNGHGNPSVNAQNNDYDDQEKDDPNDVDGLLTQELLRLSLADRNDLQEEVHGVRCLAPKETPSLLEKSLEGLQRELDAIPDSMKTAYLKSQKLVLDKKNRCNGQTDITTTYVNTSDFRLRFLRCELFDIAKAATRMTKFLDIVLELFGEYALQRPMRLSDFSKTELRHFRKGRYQFLPYRDRAGAFGRRILMCFPDADWEATPPFVRNKMFTYMLWTIGEDVEAQRAGIVVVAWFDPSFKVSKQPPAMIRDHETLSVRVSAIHICSPDTPLFRIRRATTTMRIGHNRKRLKQHVGRPIEFRYALQSFGIPTEQFPITFTGKLKLTYFRQWLRLRELVEDKQCLEHNVSNCIDATMMGYSSICGEYNFQDETFSSTSDTESNSVHNAGSTGATFIESPYLNDIIFRKGANTSSHPGNTALRSSIIAKTKLELQVQHEQQTMSEKNNVHHFDMISKDNQKEMNSNNDAKRSKIRIFVSEIIQDIREMNLTKSRPSRFLVFNEGGWWMELTSEPEIHTRIKYIARGIRNSVTKNYRLSTSLLYPPTGISSSLVSTKTATTTATNMPIDVFNFDKGSSTLDLEDDIFDPQHDSESTKPTNCTSFGNTMSLTQDRLFPLPTTERFSPFDQSKMGSMYQSMYQFKSNGADIGRDERSKKRRFSNGASSIFDVGGETETFTCEQFGLGFFSR